MSKDVEYKEPTYTGVHETYEGVHDLYPGVHDQYPGVITAFKIDDSEEPDAPEEK